VVITIFIVIKVAAVFIGIFALGVSLPMFQINALAGLAGFLVMLTFAVLYWLFAQLFQEVSQIVAGIADSTTEVNSRTFGAEQ
jgi:hypothetical protein